jgi:hypothetical protein
MKTYRLHTFFVPVYLELLPDDWKGEADPRAPRLLLRSMTVADLAESEMELANRRASGGATSDPSELVRRVEQDAAQLSAFVLRCLGDWQLAGYKGTPAEMRHLELNHLYGALRFIQAATEPDEVADLAPLGGGLAPSAKEVPPSHGS